MKLLKTILIILVLCSVSAPSVSCASESDSAVPENQIVAVQRGDLKIDITAVGNLALSLKEDLAFEMSGVVEEILVEEGESVEEGQLLAKLDTTEWERELAALENDLLQAEINLQTAENNLDAIEEVKEAQRAVEDAEWDFKIAQARLQEALETASGGDPNYWREHVIWAQSKLTEAQQNLAEILGGTSTAVTIEVASEVALKELQFELAQRRLEAAQKAVEEVLEASPEITAPFDGFVTKVNVEGGDEVLKGTVAVTIADPDEFEADILVSEMDILQVNLGGEAWVQVDAVQGLVLPAEVTHISPTATIQSGVVNYGVKVEIESLEAVQPKRQESGREAIQGIMEGELPERIRQAIEEGRITQEQVDEMIRQRQQGQGGQQAMPTMLLEGFQLREGLTVTVSILVEERNDVLLVPNGAITSRGGRAYVQVISPDGTTEERPVTTGLSDWQFTEVTEGLNEGEKVVVTGTATTTPMTPQPEGKLPFFPGKR